MWGKYSAPSMIVIASLAVCCAIGACGDSTTGVPQPATKSITVVESSQSVSAPPAPPPGPAGNGNPGGQLPQTAPPLPRPIETTTFGPPTTTTIAPSTTTTVDSPPETGVR
jgi:hypothetical protein